MFSKYDEISKIILNYINESLMKPMADVSTLNASLQSQFGFSLSEKDITDLRIKIESAKNTRIDYENGLNNQHLAVTDWSNALEKAKDLVAKKESEVRGFGYTLAKKICIASYKGPLTIDTMKELKENGYDGTYGSTTMIQMYALYNQNQKLEEESKQKDAIIVNNNKQVQQYEASYRELFIQNEKKDLEKQKLIEENNSLKTHLTEQTNVINTLSEKIENMSKKLTTQIMELIKAVLQKPNYVSQETMDEKNKTM